MGAWYTGRRLPVQVNRWRALRSPFVLRYVGEIPQQEANKSSFLIDKCVVLVVFVVYFIRSNGPPPGLERLYFIVHQELRCS